MGEPVKWLTWEARKTERLPAFYRAERGHFAANIWQAVEGGRWATTCNTLYSVNEPGEPEDHEAGATVDSLELAKQWAEQQAAAYREALLAEAEAWQR